DQGLPGAEISRRILEEIDIAEVVRKSSANWDGGYLLSGALGNGDCFVLRDPHGIRPGFYFEDDEVVAAASERAPLMTVFGKRIDEVKEIPAGGMMVVKRDGALRHEVIRQPAPTPTSCTFERIYFSRGNDADIYRERKQLGANLAPKIWQAIDGDLENAVFSYIPNTAETAYLGLMDELRRVRRREVKKEILSAARDGSLDEALIDRLILSNWPRGEKIAHKDVKLRTFISQEKWRSDLVSHVYDVTYGLVTPEDTLVCVDDSIVRGTTLKQSILKILSSLNPRRIIIASTAPQIRYPDCYGIDMSELGRFVAFQAMVALLEERGSTGQLREVYLRCLAQSDRPPEQMVNHVRALYDLFTEEEIAAKISALVRPRDVPWTGKVEILFQSVEGLHAALPRHAGDWYFTGRYPTPGGYRVLNQAFINFYEKKAKRSY
ncbi:MAG: amidophosphoribosyltransferase, partial [Puniceicoccaceae bacterium]